MGKLLSDESAIRVRQLIDANVPPSDGRRSRGDPISRAVAIVRCSSTLAADTVGVGAQCFPGKALILNSLVDEQEEGANVWITIVDGISFLTPVAGNEYIGVVVGQFDPAPDDEDFTDSRPRVIVASSSANSNLSVAEVDLAPTVPLVGLMLFDQADGFIVSQPSANVARIDHADAAPAQRGIVSLTTQTLGTGAKSIHQLLTVYTDTTQVASGSTSLAVKNPATASHTAQINVCEVTIQVVSAGPEFWMFRANWQAGGDNTGDTRFLCGATDVSFTGEVHVQNSYVLSGANHLYDLAIRADASISPGVYPNGLALFFYFTDIHSSTVTPFSFHQAAYYDNGGSGNRHFAVFYPNNASHEMWVIAGANGGFGHGPNDLGGTASTGGLVFQGGLYMSGSIAPGSIAGFNEAAQDAVGGILIDSNSIDFTYNDPANTITADVRVQMSIVIDSSGLKLSGDEASPGNNEFYGTNGSGVKGWYPSTAAYTDEQAQDAVAAMSVDTSTINVTYTDGTPELKWDVITQMSITSDGSGLKLSGDVSSPGGPKYYGTDSGGTKGYHEFPGIAGAGGYATGSVQTTDATQTTCGTLTLADESTYLIEVHIAAHSTSAGSGAACLMLTGYREDGAGAQIAGSVTVVHEGGITSNSWAVTCDTSGNTIRTRVTGAFSIGVDWRVSMYVRRISP